MQEVCQQLKNHFWGDFNHPQKPLYCYCFKVHYLLLLFCVMGVLILQYNSLFCAFVNPWRGLLHKHLSKIVEWTAAKRKKPFFCRKLI